MHATSIATGAPAWVYVLLAGLIALGVRRLRTREVPIVVALLPAVAFLAWSLVGADAYANRVGAATALAFWLSGAAAGGVSGFLLPEPRGERLPGGAVRQPGSRLPLVLYLAVFVVRFTCGAWAAIRPEQASLADGIGLAVGAAMTARLVVGVVRWRSVRTSGAIGV